MNVGVSYQWRVNSEYYATWIMLHDTWATYNKQPTLVIQAEGRRIPTKKQKKTSMKEEKIVPHYNRTWY